MKKQYPHSNLGKYLHKTKKPKAAAVGKKPSASKIKSIVSSIKKPRSY